MKDFDVTKMFNQVGGLVKEHPYIAAGIGIGLALIIGNMLLNMIPGGGLVKGGAGLATLGAAGAAGTYFFPQMKEFIEGLIPAPANK